MVSGGEAPRSETQKVGKIRNEVLTPDYQMILEPFQVAPSRVTLTLAMIRVYRGLIFGPLHSLCFPASQTFQARGI